MKDIKTKVSDGGVVWEWIHKTIPNLYFRVKSCLVSQMRPDGTWTKAAPYYVFDRGESVCAVIHETDTGKVIFVRQYRTGTKEVLIELPAGMLEKGEDPAIAVMREVFEETGYSSFITMKLLYSLRLSPGGYTEISHIFYIQVNSSDKTGEGGGLAKENEFLEILQIPADEAISMIEARAGKLPEITDAKTVAGLLWLKTQK